MQTMKRWVALVAMASVLPAAVQAQGRTPAEMASLRDSAAAVGGRVIIRLKSSQPGAALRAPGSPPIGTAELDQIQTRLVTKSAMRTSGRAELIGAVFATVDASRLDSLNADPNVVSIEPDRLMYPAETHDERRALMVRRSVRDVTRTRATSQDLPWGISQIGAPTAWAQGYRGDGVKVGIMDSGGDATHPDLVWAGGYSAINSGTTTADWADNVASCNGHGTHVAGTVAAQDNGFGVVGVAPNVQLYSLKVFVDFSGSCAAFTSSMILAVQWASAHGIRVINASIGGAYASSFKDAVDQAAAAGTFLVAAAGNDNGGAVEYPAAYPSAIAVSSLSGSNTVSSFSSVGPTVWVGAPGESIESTMPGGGYGYKSGTSMATPHVTGAVALLVQQNPNITLQGVRDGLRAGALDVDAAGFDNNTGWGLVRINNSLSGSSGTPISLALSPGARSVTVQQGNTPPSDAATVTMSGTGSTSTTWTATRRAAWNTLTTASGTGSGTLAWSRSINGLAVGTYVDTITVTAPGAASGSPATIYDTLRVTAATIPVTMALSPASRTVTVQQGNSPAGSNATLSFTGTNAATTAWTITKRAAWNTLGSSSGTGNATLAWTRSTASLGAGTYVDTITVTAPGAANGSPGRIYDSLIVTPAPIPVTMAVSPVGHAVSVQQGNSAPSDSASVTLSGTNASSATWSTTKKASWNTLVRSTGTGNGILFWSRNSAGLAVGTYVDTISVSAPAASSGSPSLIFDTLRITAAPIPVTLAVSPSGRSASAQQGSPAPGDNATLAFTGTNASSTAWTASRRASWNTLTTTSGTGNATLSWNRSTAGLAVGTYVDTIAVTAPGAANGSPAWILDTLRVTSVPVPLVLAVSPVGRTLSVQQGSAAPPASATVTISGTGAASIPWTATRKANWNTLTSSSGTGSGTLSWTRSTTTLAIGRYVDTITVSAPGVSSGPIIQIFDTVNVTAVPAPIVLSVTPATQSVSTPQGTAAPSTSIAISITGASSSLPWGVTTHKSWTYVTYVSAQGNGTVSWNRYTASLPVGVYVDTITITAPGATVGSPAVVYDTVRITAALVPIVATLSPASHTVSVQQGTAAPRDSAQLTISGTSASSTAWNVTNRTTWNAFPVTSGTGTSTIGWTRNSTGLGSGLYVDTITVSTPNAATGAVNILYDTLRITTAPVPVTLAIAPTFRTASMTVGTGTSNDNAVVALAGTGASSTAWTATRRKSWNTLVVSSGTGSGNVSWSRNVAGLGVGVYVDTITVTASGAASGSPALLFDTLRVTAATIPVTVALTPTSRSVAVVQGNQAPGDVAFVTLSGTNAATTAWTATRAQSWNTLVTASGTGSGTLSWSRTAPGLRPGVYVDTITVSVAGLAPVRLFDTLQITAANVPVTLALTPASRSVTMTRGAGVTTGTAAVTLAGTGADAASWGVSNRAPWNTLATTGGVGSGTVVWTRHAQGLTTGTYVDTITVTAPGASGVNTLRVIDTLRINSVVLAFGNGGRSRTRALSVSGTSSVLAFAVDSTTVSGGDASDVWLATTNAPRLQLVRDRGVMGTSMVWQRNSTDLAIGLHVDTLVVRLQADSTVRGFVIDSLDVVQVTLPEPNVAISDLFRAGAISDDQRTVLDRLGNNNGRYDLGDFLAWVDRSHLHLSAEVASRLQSLQVPATPASPARP